MTDLACGDSRGSGQDPLKSHTGGTKSSDFFVRDVSIASQTLRNDGDDHGHAPDRSRTSVGVPCVARDTPAPLIDVRTEFIDGKSQN